MSFNNRTKKKLVFSKSKNQLPDMILLSSKRNLSTPKPKLNPVIEEPKLIFKQFVEKPDNICKNADCQNININDINIGKGYCSVKCVVEHSKFLFNEWVFKRNFKEKSHSPKKIPKLSSSPKKPPSTSNIFVDNLPKQNLTDAKPFAFAQREPLFHVLLEEYANGAIKQHKTETGHANNTDKKSISTIPQPVVSRELSPDVVFVSHTTSTRKKRAITHPQCSYTPTSDRENGEPITIVID